MAKATYRVITTSEAQEAAALTDYNASAYNNVMCPYTADGGTWTALNASEWAHTHGAKLPAGTTIAVQRQTSARRGWEPYKSYMVGSDGIVSRSNG